jgi:protein ImuA
MLDSRAEEKRYRTNREHERIPMRESNPALRLLRRQIAAIDRRHGGDAGRRADERITLGYAGIDAALGGGLARGHLHELFAAEAEDAASAAAFAAMLACRIGGATLWLREERAERAGGLFAPGLRDIGLDPARLFCATLPDDRALLRATGDALRCAALDVLVIELWRRAPLLDLTASRRIALAAEQGGVTALLLRIDADPAPSAGRTRWRIAAAPSVPLAANAPGHPAFDLNLLRQRGGADDGQWRVEWDHDQARFRAPGAGATPLPRPFLPHSTHRSVTASGERRSAA